MRRIRELGLRESAREAKTIVQERAAARIYGIRDRYFNPTTQEKAQQLVKGLLDRPDFLPQLKTRTTPRFFLDHEPGFYRDSIRRYFPEEESRIIAAADRIRRRTFDLLGSGPKDLRDLPWHTDFKAGYAWSPSEYYRNIRYANLPGVDVKVPWELSRFQHAIFLGQAYWLTGDEAYAGEFKDQFLDWIDKNPCKYGVNW